MVSISKNDDSLSNGARMGYPIKHVSSSSGIINLRWLHVLLENSNQKIKDRINSQSFTLENVLNNKMIIKIISSFIILLSFYNNNYIKAHTYSTRKSYELSPTSKSYKDCYEDGSKSKSPMCRG